MCFTWLVIGLVAFFMQCFFCFSKKKNVGFFYVRAEKMKHNESASVLSFVPDGFVEQIQDAVLQNVGQRIDDATVLDAIKKSHHKLYSVNYQEDISQLQWRKPVRMHAQVDVDTIFDMTVKDLSYTRERRYSQQQFKESMWRPKFNDTRTVSTGRDMAVVNSRNREHTNDRFAFPMRLAPFERIDRNRM
jgi:hypothetical protein